MTVQAIKLVTGEELLADVERTVGGITIKNPLVVQVKAGPQGYTVGFYPWTLMNSGDITINDHALVSVFDVPGDVEANYIQNTTGIQIASGLPSQLITG
jgi:hypothetical protein